MKLPVELLNPTRLKKNRVVRAAGGESARDETEKRVSASRIVAFSGKASEKRVFDAVGIGNARAQARKQIFRTLNAQNAAAAEIKLRRGIKNIAA